MKNESYWKALSQALVESGFETAPINLGVLPVHWRGKLLGWVEPDGSALFDVDTHTAHREACETVSRVAERVYESISAMDAFPPPTEKGRQFTDEQLRGIYQCIQDALEQNWELSERRERTLGDIMRQIESAVPDLRERMEQEAQLPKMNM